MHFVIGMSKVRAMLILYKEGKMRLSSSCRLVRWRDQKKQAEHVQEVERIMQVYEDVASGNIYTQHRLL